jgi:CDP-diacylglycerol--glycerol-3-phosphate 3-phosphatidyltransferase
MIGGRESERVGSDQPAGAPVGLAPAQAARRPGSFLHPSINNLPNQLTLGRLVLAIVLFVLIAGRGWIASNWLWCNAVFALAAFTDWLDGYLARKQGLTSTLGRNLDPLVDKVLTCGAYIFLLEVPDHAAGLWPWMVTVVVARELIITGLRGFIEQLGANFGADWLGKIKMGLQCAALFAIFTSLGAQDQSASEAILRPLVTVRDVLIYSMLIVTSLSGLQYLWRAAALLRVEH